MYLLDDGGHLSVRLSSALSGFWGSLAYTLIGGTAAGTVLTLVFLPALYSVWFRVKPEQSTGENQNVATSSQLAVEPKAN